MYDLSRQSRPTFDGATQCHGLGSCSAVLLTPKRGTGLHREFQGTETRAAHPETLHLQVPETAMSQEGFKKAIDRTYLIEG